jgi:hypothetical protein
MKTGAEQLQHRSSNHTPGPIFCRPIRADSCHSHKSPVRVPFVGIIRLNPGSLVQISVAAPPESDPIRLNPTIKKLNFLLWLPLLRFLYQIRPNLRSSAVKPFQKQKITKRTHFGFFTTWSLLSHAQVVMKPNSIIIRPNPS